jgi:hypothetical protein
MFGGMFKPTIPAPAEWDVKTIHRVLRSAVPRKGPWPEDGLTFEDAFMALLGPFHKQPADEQQAKEVMKTAMEGVQDQVGNAVKGAASVSGTMEGILKELYQKNPAGKEVSLRWTDDDVNGPFSKLDTIEKVIRWIPDRSEPSSGIKLISSPVLVNPLPNLIDSKHPS